MCLACQVQNRWTSVLGRGLEFDMKCHILHVVATSVAFQEKSSGHFKDIYKF